MLRFVLLIRQLTEYAFLLCKYAKFFLSRYWFFLSFVVSLKTVKSHVFTADRIVIVASQNIRQRQSHHRERLPLLPEYTTFMNNSTKNMIVNGWIKVFIVKKQCWVTYAYSAASVSISPRWLQNRRPLSSTGCIDRSSFSIELLTPRRLTVLQVQIIRADQGGWSRLARSWNCARWWSWRWHPWWWIRIHWLLRRWRCVEEAQLVCKNMRYRFSCCWPFVL